MIKPFKVLDVTECADKSKIIAFEVARSTTNEDGSTSTITAKATIGAPEDVTDIDQYLFDKLSKAGWF